MANLQRIFGDDGLPYLIDASGDGFNTAYLPRENFRDDLELGSESLSFFRSDDAKDDYRQGMSSFEDVQMTRPIFIDAVDGPGDLSKLAFLSPEKENYQDANKGAFYGKGAGNEIEAQFKKEFRYPPSNGELNQYASMSGKSSPSRSVLFIPSKIETGNAKIISDNVVNNIKNGNLNFDSVPFYSIAQHAAERGRTDSTSGANFFAPKSSETLPRGLLAMSQNTQKSGSGGVSLRPTVRVYSSDAFGLPGLNHAYVASSETKQQKGRDGLFGITKGEGGYGFENPYHSVTLPDGMTDREFMNRIESYSGWNGGLWFPWLNDCHNDLEKAFKHAGVPYSGAPNGRLDIDETVERIVNEARQWAETRTSGGRRR